MAKNAPPSDKSRTVRKIRTFVAVSLPEAILKQLAELVGELKTHPLRVKWSAVDDIHLTLKFLGDISPEDVDPACAALAAASRPFAPFPLRASGVGVFPNIRRPRVLWTGLAGQVDRLAAFQRAIDRRLGELGHPEDERRFTGHLTLGRFKGHQDPDVLIDIMKTCSDMTSDAFAVDSVSVFKSDLKPSGPVYTPLSTIRLGD